MTIVGKHIIAEFYGVEPEKISFVDTIKETMERVAEESGLTTIRGFFHQFQPQGVTGIILLSESHLSIHTWPEHSLVNLDIFTCGEPEKADRAFELFVKYLEPKSYRHYVLDRG